MIAHPDHTMFLKVNDVSGVTSTSERSNASLFYVEQIKSNHLHLTYYETSYNAKHRKKPLYVTMKRSTIIGRSRREHGQLTVESEIDQKDSCFKLKHQIQGSKTPATALERWMNGEPFFIKTAYGHPFKREQFLTITSTGATGMNSRTTPLCLLSGT